MRADRLVATLLVLQSKGRVTAAELASELEISVKTARRDLEALSMAGVPVYPQRGRGGGWQLVGGARTDLTGLTASEVQALFLTVGTSTMASPELKAAVRKLVQALPETFRSDATTLTDAVVVDATRWGRRGVSDQPTFLEPLQEAIVRGRQIQLGYATPGKTASRRVAHPLGLVTKAGVWYLVADTERGQRVFRVSRVTSVKLLDEALVKPVDFDLGAAWNDITVALATSPRLIEVDARATAWALGPLRFLFGERLVVGVEQPDGRFAVTLSGNDVASVGGQIAAVGNAVEVLSPESVRTKLAEIGAELTALYAA